MLKKLTERQKEVINDLGDKTYTVKYIESFIYREDVTTFNNAIAACIINSCCGYVAAVNRIIEKGESK
jgi:hypothetical protein